MATDVQYRIVDERDQTSRSMHPHRFVLWLILVSVTMMFAAFTSAYIVRRADGNWLYFELPQLFYWSSGVILVSSLTMHAAFYAARRDLIAPLKGLILTTFVLGLVFLYLQVMGWNEMVSGGVYFAGTSSNPAGSFVYVISLMHGVHIVAGLIFLLVVLVKAFLYQVHAKSMLTIRMCTTFWHFLDALWLYLFLFMLLNR
ncbi:MAG: heme-copper oxidase subunit III [Bernardetiaceae bacterium]